MKRAFNILAALCMLLIQTLSCSCSEEKPTQQPASNVRQFCDTTDFSTRYTSFEYNIDAAVIWMCRNWNTIASDGSTIRADINDPDAVRRWTFGIHKIITAAEKHPLNADITINHYSDVSSAENPRISRDVEEAIIVASKLKGDTFRNLLPKALQARMIPFEREIIQPKKAVKKSGNQVDNNNAATANNCAADSSAHCAISSSTADQNQWSRAVRCDYSHHPTSNRNRKKLKWYGGDARF